MHYYSHHIGDFQRDTASLSDADTLAYLRLIWMYYDTEQPLPDDSKKLAFRIGSDPDAVQRLLEAFFVLQNGFWNQKRCDAEIAKYRAKSDSARKANQIRWESKTHLKSDPDQIATNNQEPITIDKKPVLELPDWLPKEAWKDWCDYRKGGKGKFTDRAKVLCLGTLETLKNQGHDPVAVINSSIQNGWTGLFAPKNQPLATTNTAMPAWAPKRG
jgi:uncharacterized protein YdaU (DUF1376 family)